MARGEDAFTAADSLCRLQRLQATCGALRESEGVDALLFIGGIDGRDNLGSVRCLNFLLGGVGGVELLEREQCVGKWGEDVVLLVRPDGCEIHVGHAHYEALRPFIAAWGNVEVHTLPPRHIPNEDDGAPKRPDREDEARDDDEASSDESLGGRGDGSDDSEEEEEEEDVLQDFKLTALVSMLTGVTTVGVACTPNGPGEMETERWPLLQAYGIEGVGRSGFFTMSTNVIDTWDVIHRACFTQLDGAQLRRELARSTPPFRQHWEASLATMDARRAPGRMTLTPALAFDPLTEFFAYGTLRRPVGFGAFDEADAPRVGFGLGTDDDLRGGDDDVHLENVRASAAGHARGPALHCTVEARHPKSPGLRCARTYVFGQGCVSATAINGFTKRVDDDDATRDSENQSRLREPPRATDEADVAALVGLYAAAVAAGRDAMSAACDAWAAGAGPETWTRGDAVEVAVVGAARRAFAAAADAIGVPPHVGSDRASALDVRVDATDPSNARPSPAAGDGAIGERRGNGGDDARFGSGFGFGFGVARCLAYVRVALRGIVGVESGEPLGAIVYGDSFVPGGVRTGDGGEERSALAPLVLTSGVPLVRSWPASGAETDACEGCVDATRKMVKDARLNFRARRKARAAKKAKAEKRRAARGGAGVAEDDPAEEAAKASTADDDVFLDDELEFESEEGDENAAPGNSDAEGPEEGPEDDDGDDFFASSDDDDDDDDDAARSFAPLASTYRVDDTLALGPSLLVPKPEPVLAFVPAFDVRSGSSSNPDPDPKPSMDPRVFDVVSGDDGARAGEWHVFDNGVAFVPDHGVPLHLVLGVNVAAIDIHDALVDADGVADAAAGPVAVFRLSRPCAIAPSHLFLREGKDDDVGSRRLHGTTSVAFSLAPLGDTSKRHFARVVVPRWRRVASGHRHRGEVGHDGSGAFLYGCEVRTGLGAYDAAAPSQAWACGRARSTRERAGGIAFASAAARAEASVAHKRFQTREPDSAVVAAASALDAKRTGLHTGTGYTHVPLPSRGLEARARDAPKETGDRDEGPSIDDDVDVTLLVGAPDGCQDEVFDALRRYASGSATWIATEAVAPCRAAESVQELARALASNVAGAARAAGRSDGGARKPRRVCVIARTYESAAEVAASVTEATTLAAELSSARTSPPTDGDAGGVVVRMRLGAVTACVAADGFFADAERRPARGALAQVTPPACDNVVLLPTGAASRGAALSFSSFSSAPGAVPAPTSQELLEDAGAWIRAVIRARGGDVNVTVGARRLLSSPLAAATATKKNLAPPSGVAFAAASSFAVPPTSDSRRKLARRRVVAEGDVDLRAVVSCVRGMFALGRRARPKSPEELRRLTPDERLAYDLTRFAEVDPASPVVAHAEIAATIGGDGDATTTFRRVYNFTAAARGEDVVVDGEDGTDATGAVATRVEITVSGSNVAGEGLNLAERVRACAHRGPPPRPLRTAASLREEELAAVARRCKEEADLPTGWYYDGAVYVSYDGLRRTSAHPRMDEYVGATVEEMNGAIEEWNARAEEARNALRGVTITAEEVRTYA